MLASRGELLPGSGGLVAGVGVLVGVGVLADRGVLLPAAVAAVVC